MTAFEIQKMAAADIDAAVDLLYSRGWDERRSFLELMLATPNCRPLVGVRDGAIIATGQGVVNGWTRAFETPRMLQRPRPRLGSDAHLEPSRLRLRLRSAR